LQVATVLVTACLAKILASLSSKFIVSFGSNAAIALYAALAQPLSQIIDLPMYKCICISTRVGTIVDKKKLLKQAGVVHNVKS